MSRQIGSERPAVAEQLKAPTATDNLGAWLRAQVTEEPAWLLAHADDGVIWGVYRDGALHLSAEVEGPSSPPLRSETLRTARLFAPGSEVFLWRTSSPDHPETPAWSARMVRDAGPGETPNFSEYINESYLLWGSDATPSRHVYFILLNDGAQGMQHMSPLPANGQIGHLPLRLLVRHYVEEDERGALSIVLSRLCELTEGSPQ